MTLLSAARPSAAVAEDILAFWFEETKPWQWFRRSAEFDQSIRGRFGALHEAASAGRLDVWRTHPQHSLALILLLDQFSRNIYRDNPRAFSQDERAVGLCKEIIRRRFDMAAVPKMRSFFYMPFMHAENLDDQETSVRLFKSRMPGSSNVFYATQHHDIIARFDRFPHRNKTLGRTSTPEEIAFLKAGGFNP